jgi:hypothetical protein
MNNPKIRKSAGRLVADLESQLKFIREAVQALAAEPDRYKIVAAGLRVLVCDFRSNKPLLLDLMDELELDYTISPRPDLPFPLPMVDELDQGSDVDFSSMMPDEIWAYHRSQGKSYSLREFVARGLAVYVLGHAYSYSELIRTLAEQSGLGHEDRTIDRNILELESLILGGYRGHTAPIRALADHVISACVNVVNKAATLGYQPHYLVSDPDGRYVLPKFDKVV